jgi:hypothetical protein
MASTVAAFDSSGFLPAGALKTLVYAVPVDKEEELYPRIVDAFRQFATTPPSAVHDETCRGGH